jgi:hypothetical protein
VFHALQRPCWLCTLLNGAAGSVGGLPLATLPHTGSPHAALTTNIKTTWKQVHAPANGATRLTRPSSNTLGRDGDAERVDPQSPCTSVDSQLPLFTDGSVTVRTLTGSPSEMLDGASGPARPGDAETSKAAVRLRPAAHTRSLTRTRSRLATPLHISATLEQVALHQAVEGAGA